MTSESTKKQLQTYNQVSQNSHPSPSYSFHGSNSSHSTDNGLVIETHLLSGARTYHISNYATSYANKKSSLISVTFEEDKNTSRSIMTVVVFFLLFTAVPLSIMAWKPLGLAQYIHAHATRTTEFVRQPVNVPAEETWNPVGDDPAEDKVESSQNPPSEGAKDLPRPNDRRTWNLSWDGPKPDKHCLAFGTREYTARLWNIPFYANWTKTCENTQAIIHGVVITKPTFCENKWPFGGVIGHWTIDFGEEDCLASWGKVTDKGCVKHNSKLRRYQARLSNINKAEDWSAICSTAPVKIHGLSIPKPTVCENKGFWGVYGVWDVEDNSC